VTDVPSEEEVDRQEEDRRSQAGGEEVDGPQAGRQEEDRRSQAGGEEVDGEAEVAGQAEDRRSQAGGEEVDGEAEVDSPQVDGQEADVRSEAGRAQARGSQDDEETDRREVARWIDHSAERGAPAPLSRSRMDRVLGSRPRSCASPWPPRT
jgi:hypothetical protein